MSEITIEKLRHTFETLLDQASYQKEEPKIIVNGYDWLALASAVEIIEKENKCLKAELNKANLDVDNLIQERGNQHQEITKLREQLRIAKDALEFYGNRDCYDTHVAWGKVVVVASDCDRSDFLKVNVAGKRARQALAEIEEVK